MLLLCANRNTPAAKETLRLPFLIEFVGASSTLISCSVLLVLKVLIEFVCFGIYNTIQSAQSFANNYIFDIRLVSH